MARRTKAQEEMLENQRKMTEIKEEELELLPTGTSPEQETSQENTEERTNIENIVTEEELEQTTNVKVKEIKYGFSVLTNIGNFENIRTQIEVSAEIGEEDKIEDVLEVLSKQVKNWGRKEYKDIKRRTSGNN